MPHKNNETRIPRVCLCGRPNVGKSSLFNRLIGRKKALVLDRPGVTRDVYRKEVEWEGHTFELADLAGLELLTLRDRPKHDRDRPQYELQRLAADAALKYLKEVDLVLFIADARQPRTPMDEELARVVRASGKNVRLVLTKVEGNVEEAAQSELSELGWGEGLPTSAEHNRGIEDLKEAILKELFPDYDPNYRPEETDEDEEELEELPVPVLEQPEGLNNSPARGISLERPIRLGVYGRPNVGKSTLVNYLLQEERMITSPIAGTTVDTVDTNFKRGETYYRILDTAGIRRKSKTEKGVEVLSVVQALNSLTDVDIALFMIDGYEGVTDQDEKIAGEIVRAGKAVIIVVNKWDLCGITREEYAEKLREALGFMEFAPILFASAKDGSGLEDSMWDLIEEIIRQRMNVVGTGELNRFIEIVEGTNNPLDARLYYATQTSKNPPTITFMVNDPNKVHFAYERFIKNELRNRYGWMGSPVKLIFKARKRSKPKKTRT